VISAGLAIFMVSALLFFTFGLGVAGSFSYALVGTLLVTLIAFLFAPVSARAIAIVGTNPVSGMTMLTLIITGFVLRNMGLSGGEGMFVTMMIGGVVCTALAASGALASDLKVGHWLGATGRQLATAGTLVRPCLRPGDGCQSGDGGRDPHAAYHMKEILVGIFGVAQPLRGRSSPRAWCSR
jgi:uncharacterized oligopeptide transporter (OPT) family protein